MTESKEVQNKIAQLQMLEQNIQNFSMQRQTLQTQVIEIDNALEELEKSKGTAYKIIGSVMVASEKESLKKELISKKEIIAIKNKSILKQEEQLREKANKLQEEVLKEIKK